ncbi:MAG TPA: PAS domain S-box protein, partial [Armatimonadetes bacterium]|nr:PAS domain S-box protein [Armatimonadota bacterium]
MTMSRSQWRRELTAFLRSQQEEIVRQWADAILEIPGIRAIRTVTREEYETGMHEFLPLLLAHLENPEDLRLHEYLRQFAEKCYRVQLPEADVNRAQWFLKRILIRLLVGEFTTERSKLAYLCDLVEEEIDENRLLVSQFYHLLAQERLRESEQLTRALLNNTEEYLRTLVADSADGIIILDPEGCIQSWSRGAEAIFGYPAEEAIGRPMSFLVPEEIQARGELDWLAKEVEREGCVRHYLAERVAKDGRRLTVDLTCTALRDEEGRIRAYSLIVRDLTERRRLEQETQAQASRLQTIQELTRAISASLDREAVFAAIVAEIRRIIPFDRLSLALLEPDGQHLRFWVLADEQALASPSHDALLRKGETTLGRVVEEQKPLHISDLAEHEPLLPVDVTVLGQGVRSVLSVPLVGPQGVLGTVNLCARKPNLYHQAHLNLLTDISAPIAIAVQNVRAFEEVRKRALQFEIIHAVSTSAIDKYEDIDTLLRDVADNVHNHFQYYDVAILEIDETRGELLLKAHAGVHRQFQEAEYRQSLDQGILGYVARTGETYLANNVAEDPYYFDPLAGALPIQSELAVPIKIGERVWGVLDVQSPRLNGFDEWDKVALEALCAQLSRVLEVAENVRQVRMWQVLNENVIDLIPTALVVLDRDLRICRANERFCRRFNRQPTEVVGIPLQEVFPSTLLEAIRLEQALAEMKPGEYREWEEVPYTDGQGTERIAELRVRRLDVHDLRYVLVLHDVTERTKQLYQLQMLHQIGQAMQRTLDLDRL